MFSGEAGQCGSGAINADSRCCGTAKYLVTHFNNIGRRSIVVVSPAYVSGGAGTIDHCHHWSLTGRCLGHAQRIIVENNEIFRIAGVVGTLASLDKVVKVIVGSTDTHTVIPCGLVSRNSECCIERVNSGRITIGCTLICKYNFIVLKNLIVIPVHPNEGAIVVTIRIATCVIGDVNRSGRTGSNRPNLRGIIAIVG